jgi:hypothetical protein
MKTSRWIIATVVMSLCLCGFWTSGAYGLTEKQLSLKDIKTVYVFVQGVTEETKKEGLTSESVQKRIEKKLTSLGISVVSEEEGRKLPGSPVLYVNISAGKRKEAAAYVYHVDIGLMQKIRLERDEQIRIMGITWTKGQLGHCPSQSFAKTVGETIDYLMTQFEEDWKQANPGAQVKEEK